MLSDETQRQVLMALFGALALGFFGLALRRRRQGKTLANTGDVLVRWEYSAEIWARFVRAERALAWAQLRGHLVWVALTALGPVAGFAALGAVLNGTAGARDLLPAGVGIGAGAAALLLVLQVSKVAQRDTLTARRATDPQPIALSATEYTEGQRLRTLYRDREVRLIGGDPAVLEIVGCATHRGVRRIAHVERLPVPHGCEAEAATLIEQLQKGF